MFRAILFSMAACVGMSFAMPSFAQEAAAVEDISVDQLSQQAASFRRIIAKLESDAEGLKAELDKGREELITVQTDENEIRNTLANLEDVHATRQQGLEELTEQLAQKQADLEELDRVGQTKADELEQQRVAVLDAMAESEARKEQLNAEVAEIVANRDALLVEVSQLEENLADRKAEYVATANLAAMAKSQQQDLKSEADKLRAQRDAYTKNIEAANGDLNAIRAEIDQANQQKAAALKEADDSRIVRDDALVELGKTQSVTASAQSEYRDVKAQLVEVQGLLEESKRDVLLAESRAAEVAEQTDAQSRSADDRSTLFVQATQQAEAKLADLKNEQNSAETTLAALQTRIDQAKAELAKLADHTVTPVVPVAVAVKPPAPSPPLAHGDNRPLHLVAAATRAAPGLEIVSPAKMQELQKLLTEGVCTHEALLSVFNAVNRQTLLSLVRDLGRC